MAGEKAKENKTLKAPCGACGKELSVELLRGLQIGYGRGSRIVALCADCAAAGWSPPPPRQLAAH